MKRILLTPFVNGAILIGVVALLVSISWYQSNLRPFGAGSTASTTFVIPKGQSVGIIAKRLEEEHLVQSARATKLYLYLSQNQDALQAGSFKLSPGETVPQIIEQLKHGTLDTWVTIPEGWRAEQVIDELREQKFFANEEINILYEKFRSQEGRLFPDTYLFAKNSSPEQIIEKMTAEYDEKVTGLAPSTGEFLSSVLIIASLVEREAKRGEDRPLIAGVLMNRLKIGMPLQVDATLQYARDNAKCEAKRAKCEWWEPITGEDKSVKSLYNTYMNSGLPPGPIANPGLASIKAAIEPAKTDYLYYLSEPDGTTHYAETVEEHNKNITRFLR